MGFMIANVFIFVLTSSFYDHSVNAEHFYLTNGTDGMKLIQFRAFEKCSAKNYTNEATEEHYGIEFWLPNEGGNCDEGLLICYPALLQLGNHSDTVTNFKAKRAFTIDDKKDDIAKECGERMAKDGNKNCKFRWHGIKLRTVPMRTDNGTVSHSIIRLEATIASKPFNLGEKLHQFLIIFGENRIDECAMQNDFVANLHQNGIAFLADYAALWLLGLDMLPMYNKQQQQEMKLFISQSCSCTMEAWFVQSSDSVGPFFPKMPSAGSASSPPKLTDKIFPINLTNNGEQKQIIKIKGLTDANIRSILVELLSAKKGSETKTEARFIIGTDSDLEVTLPRLSKSIRSKGVRLATGIYVLNLDIVLTKRCYLLRMNGTQLGRPMCPLEGNLPLEEISGIKVLGQMLLLGDPQVKQYDDDDWTKFIQNEPPQKRFDWWALPKGSAPLDCARLFANDAKYISQMVRRRISREEDPAENMLDMSCTAIRSRNRFWHGAKDDEQGKKDAEEHANYPMAQIRAVYKDYVVVELEFAATFSPLNWYCFVVDAASPALFKRRVRALAKCFPNVIMGDERPMKSDGEGMMEAVLDCFERLDTPKRKWEYVTLLQNHDTAIKTRVQMAQIFAWMDGANDVQVLVPPPGRVDKIKAMDWSFEALNLFKNATRNSAVAASASAHGFPAHLELAKGGFHASLTRAMVQFIRLELNLTELVRRMNLIGFGRDEIMLITLHSADQLNAPGGFTQTCFRQKNGRDTRFLTREALWAPHAFCPSHKWRHAVCIFGVEDLARLVKFPHLFFNKFWPAFDFGALLCVYERLFNMTHLHTCGEQLAKMAPVVNKSFVQQLPNVRFQQFKKEILCERSKVQIISDDQLTFNETMSFNCDGE